MDILNEIKNMMLEENIMEQVEEDFPSIGTYWVFEYFQTNAFGEDEAFDEYFDEEQDALDFAEDFISNLTEQELNAINLAFVGKHSIIKVVEDNFEVSDWESISKFYVGSFEL